MNKIEKAIEFAAKAHRSQTRKGTDTPYITHPFAVALILQKAGCDDDVIAAGLLHDTLEDTDTTEEQLREQFGQNVLEIIKGCSEPDKGASWEERKEHTLESLKAAPHPVRQVVCADKLHNLRSIKRDLDEKGENVWTKFKRGRESQAWYYKGIVKSMEYSSSFPLLEQLKAEVQELFGEE